MVKKFTSAKELLECDSVRKFSLHGVTAMWVKIEDIVEDCVLFDYNYVLKTSSKVSTKLIDTIGTTILIVRVGLTIGNETILNGLFFYGGVGPIGLWLIESDEWFADTK